MKGRDIDNVFRNLEENLQTFSNVITLFFSVFGLFERSIVIARSL